MNERHRGRDGVWLGDVAGVHVLSQQAASEGRPPCLSSCAHLVSCRLTSAPGQRAEGPGLQSDADAAGEPTAVVAYAAGAAGQGRRAGGAHPREEGPLPQARGV